jgi:HEXXH motif-containing protein
MPPSGGIARTASGQASDMLFNYLRQFAHPGVQHREQVSTLILLTSLKETLSRLFERDEALELKEFITLAVNNSLNFSDWWHRSVGQAERFIELQDLEFPEVLLLLAVRAAELGQSGEVSVRLDRRYKMVVLGRAIEVDGNVTLLSDPTRLTFATREDRIVVERKLDEVTPNQIRSPILDSQVGWIVAGHSIDQDFILEDEFHSIFSYPELCEDIRDIFVRAFEFLKVNAPMHYLWATRVVKHIIPCVATKSRSRSSSWREAPSWVLMSCSDNVIESAEMLVHEACHQYLNLVLRIGSMVVDDKEMSYSPAVGRERPLSRVIFAFHAFANMLLFYRTIGSKEPYNSCEYVSSMLARLTSDVDVYIATLAANQNISELGRSIVDPLLEAIQISTSGILHD